MANQCPNQGSNRGGPLPTRNRCPSKWGPDDQRGSANLKLDELVANRVYGFAFIMQPLKIQGGTG